MDQTKKTIPPRNHMEGEPAAPADSSDRADPRDRRLSRGRWWLAVGLLVVAGVAAYANSFTGLFLFDDEVSISANPTIQQIWPPWQAFRPPRSGETVSGRPLLNLSFAVNYALDELNVRGYHAANLAIHLMAALTLFGILRRTFQSPKLQDRFGSSALGLALAVGLLWMLHPLQTESVTYVVQRAESLMGLFYLLTLYCTIRGCQSPWPVGWYALAILACLAGMATKEVMVTAPLVVLLYDRQFLAGSFQAALRRRWGLYLGLAATWALLAYLVFSTGLMHQTPDPGQATWRSYAWTQPQVVLHYLRLSFWPHPLCLDYDWPAVTSWAQALPSVVLVGGLVAMTIWALVRRSPWGFAGAWFFLILAPTSSVLPLRDLAFEHRMYLPLASLAALAVTGGWLGFAALKAGNRFARPLTDGLFVCLVAVVVGAMGTATFQRNRTYSSALEIWAATVTVAPNNARAHSNLGKELASCGRTAEALEHFRLAISLDPDYTTAYYNLGITLFHENRVSEAVQQYRKAQRLDPKSAEVQDNLGAALLQLGDAAEAERCFRRALELQPDSFTSHNNLGVLLSQRGKIDEAIEHYLKALEIRGDYASAHANLGDALCRRGRADEAIAHYERALAARPGDTQAHTGLGNVLLKQGKIDEAIAHYEKVVEIAPDAADSHYNLAAGLVSRGRISEAIEHYRKTLQLSPDDADAHNALGAALYRQQDYGEALTHWRKGLGRQTRDVVALNLAAWVLATHPDASLRNGNEAFQYALRAVELSGRRDPAILDTLAAAHAEAGEFSKAKDTAQAALDLATSQQNRALADALRQRMELYQSGKPFRDTRQVPGDALRKNKPGEEPSPPR